MIIHGDCLNELKKLDNDSVDLIVTDPPYGYSFMGKDWDKAVVSTETWAECLRVLKPGAFAFVMSAPRQDVLGKMISNLTDAGFKTDFTSIYWTYATGFPKAMNIGKASQAKLTRGGASPKHLRQERQGDDYKPTGQKEYRKGRAFEQVENDNRKTELTEPQAKALDGSYAGFQPKPAVEVILVAMKPLSEKTYVDQAMTNGKGVTWLDDCRVPTSELTPRTNKKDRSAEGYEGGWKPAILEPHTAGRFPANLLVSDDVLNDGVERKSGDLKPGHKRGTGINFGGGGTIRGTYGGDSGSYSRYFDLDAWAKTFPFLIVPKASKREKNEGCEKLEEKQAIYGQKTDSTFDGLSNSCKPVKNHHPTVKPLKLMSYLVTLGSREGDTVLDPFLGSGTTALAAKNLNRKWVGIEREAEYIEIAKARIESSNE